MGLRLGCKVGCKGLHRYLFYIVALSFLHCVVGLP